MVFSSITFLLYFIPFFIVLYCFTPRPLKNIVLLIGSVFFYSWGAPKFIFVILGTTILDFYLVQWMSRSEVQRKRRLLLLLSLVVNLGLLFYFKYSNFFIENVNAVLGQFGMTEIHWTKLALPIGISFYTFETLTYVIDVYRKVHQPLKRFWDYQLYIILFPKLIAGPIIRYHDLADQISDRSANENMENRLLGMYRFALGLAKKVVIANQLGLCADNIFKMPLETVDSSLAWLGILAYTFQIYFDFSGYSDMAIGLARVFGFRFPENFNNPYVSGSITEFWRRWHISLGNWMRNYLYIPLGGNKVSNARLYFNLWIVFLASGLWHGASWCFVIWGAYHGLFLVLERGFLLRWYEKIWKFPRIVLTFAIVATGWVFFRVEHVEDAFAFIGKMYSFEFKALEMLDAELMVYFGLAILFSFFTAVKIGQYIHDAVYERAYGNWKHIGWTFATICLLFICVTKLAAFGFNPFIYFRF